MSDVPWYAPEHAAATKTTRLPQPGELLFEFYRERDHTRWRCELRDHGEALGVEVQVCGTRNS